jgi:hypothetical protein
LIESADKLAISDNEIYINFSKLTKLDILNINKHTGDDFIDFCTGTSKTIDCSATGDFIYLTDAFYGVSSEKPAVCVYK